MNIVATKQIMAVVTLDRNKAGAAPIFYVDNHEELSRTALLLAVF